MNPRRRNILDVKQKAESTLNKMIQNMAKEKVLTESKSQLHIISQEMLNEVDKFIREKYYYKINQKIVKCFMINQKQRKIKFQNFRVQMKV